MRVVRRVALDRLESQPLKRALVHIRIAYPDLDTSSDRDYGAPARAVRHMQTGQATDRVVALRALAALTMLADACEEQSARDYWERLAPDDAGPVETVVTESAGVPLIRPGHDIVGVLTESREVQAREAREALAVVERALALLPDEEEVDQWTD